jgi:hypothetical protein
LVNPQKSAVDIQIPFDWKTPQLPDVNYNCKHCQEKLDLLTHVPICNKTFRPFYIINDNETWKDAFEKIIQTHSGLILSTHRWFMDLCVRFKQIPTLDEMMVFAVGTVSNDNVSTLLDYSPTYIMSVIDDFKPLIKENIQQAIELFLASAPIATRQQMELSVQ